VDSCSETALRLIQAGAVLRVWLCPLAARGALALVDAAAGAQLDRGRGGAGG
jgi:hypothetical protein